MLENRARRHVAPILDQERSTTKTTDRTVRHNTSTSEDHRRHDEDAQRWLSSARQALDEVARLPADWDSYGASPPTGAAVSAGHDLLAVLWEHRGEAAGERAIPWAIAPLADGGVQFKWRRSSEAIEEEIDPKGVFNYLVERDERTTGHSDPGTGASTKEVLDHIRLVLEPSSEA